MHKRLPEARKTIEEYSNVEINKRNKEIVVEELITEHNRAEDLAKAILVCKKICDRTNQF